MLGKPLLFFLVFLGGSVNNWVIPLVIYAKKFGLFKKRPPDFIGCNDWGIVMDVILAGGINLAITGYLLTIPTQVWLKEWQGALLLGFVSMVITHIFMAVTFWQEWIMPRPWRWNLAGYWHMVSMTIQMSFAFLPLALFYHQPELMRLPTTWLLLAVVTIFGLLFLKSLSLKNKTIKLGPMKITNRPW